VSAGSGGVNQAASASSKSVVNVAGARSSPDWGSTKRTNILFLAGSTFPYLSFLGVNPKPDITRRVPPTEGPEWGV